VEDPLARPVAAGVLLDGATAYVESAAACGLHLLARRRARPERTTTYGVGQLVRTALDRRASRRRRPGRQRHQRRRRRAAGRLGVQRVDAAGGGWPRAVPRCATVAALRGARPAPGRRRAGRRDRRRQPAARACSARSAVFGPAEGRLREDVALLDGALSRWADVLEQHLA
jgi:glycerate kinase